MQSEMVSGPELQLRRVAMGLTQTALQERIGARPGWVYRQETKARVKPADAERYLAGLATFGTVPTVEVKVA